MATPATPVLEYPLGSESISTKIIEVLSTAEHANKLHSLIGLHALLVKKYTEF